MAEGAMGVHLALAVMRTSPTYVADVGLGAVLFQVVFDWNDHAADARLTALGKEDAAVSSVPIHWLVKR